MSNQLQALLKSNKVNIVVDLDRDKSLSNIKSGLSQLTKDLDGFNIDLGVKFNPNVKELNKEIKALQTKISESKSVGNAIKLDVEIDTSIEKLNNDIQRLQGKIQNAKTIKPIKLDVVIDVQGSATKITEELGEIKGVLDRFKGDYSKALSNIKELGNAEFSDLLGDSTVRKLSSNVDNIKDYMRNAFGDGIISTKTIKDSEDNIQALSATVKKETGEIHTSLFKLGESGAFELIKQEDVNNMEAQTAKAKRSINSLADEIEKVKSVMANSKSFDMFGKLGDQEFVSAKEVENLKALVKAEKELIATNQKREEFQNALTRSMKAMSPEVSKVANEIKKLDVNLDKVDSNELDKLANQLKTLNTQYRSDEQVFNKRSVNLREINTLENKLAITYEKMAKTSTNLEMFNRANDILKEAKATSSLTSEMKDLSIASNNLKNVNKELSNINLSVQLDSQNASMKRQVDNIEKTVRKLKEINVFDDKDVARSMLVLQEKMATSETAVKEFGQTLKTQYEKAREEQKALIEGFTLIERKTTDMKSQKLQGNMFKAIEAKDVSSLKNYIGELKNGEVSTIAMKETLNNMGQAVTEVKVKMAGTGKTVEAYTFEMDKAGKATDMMVKQTSSAFVDNENKSLGFMEQMGIAMKRVPSWIISMQSFYAVINGFKSVGKEIMDIDAELIEIRRVASDGINVDSLFQSAVVQSKELGVNIHEVTNSLGEFARTYGEFSESQLMAVNKTAVIMANVSELSLEQASSNLVGTMNAFNIEAEKSIHIVDALNEVDNNYAISTMQLSDSLSKAGATAKTFGLEMEDVMGHTTAIGAVTMESGDIIGNSLKTIYSRITTLDDSVEVLDSVGVSIKEITENGMEMRGVNDIMGDLAGRWTDLTDEQRQNIGVTIAGRNQLSRFLALMNNWGMAQDSTTAAINSTGSALKEQDIYMGSYEAKINGVKTRFTELSLAIGEAFLSDSMFLAIQGVGDLTEGLTKLVSKFGVLPAVGGGIALVGAKVTGLTGNLKEMFGLMSSGGGKFKDIFSAVFATNKGDMFKGIKDEVMLLTKVFTTAGKGMGESFKAVGTGLAQSVGLMRNAQVSIGGVTVAQTGLGLATAGVSGAFTTAKVAVVGFLSSTAGIGLLLAGVGIVVGKLVEKMVKAKQETKELMEAYEDANAKSVEAYNSQRGTFNKTIADYETLTAKMNSGKKLGTEELEKYNKLTQDIANTLPNAIQFVDANGKAHLKNAESIKKEAERTRELAREQARMNLEKHSKAIEKTGTSYEKLRKEADKYQSTINSYEKQQDNPTPTSYSSYNGAGYATATTSVKQYEEAVTGAQKAQGAMSLELSKSSIEIGEYAKSTIESEGYIESMTDTGLGLIDGFSKINQIMGDTSLSTEDYKKKQDELRDSTVEFSRSLADQYSKFDNLSNAQAEKAKGMLDSVLSGMSDDFFEGSNITGKLSSFTDSIKDIAENAESFDINGFQEKLMSAGWSAEEAKTMTMELGVSLENSAIQSAIASDELVEYNSSLEDMTEKTWEAIDAKKVMMGLEDGEAQAIQSRLEYLTARKELNEDTWLSDGTTQLFIQELARDMGVSKDSITNSTREIYEAYKIMNEKGNFEINEMTTMTRDQLREANKDISEGTLNILQDALMNYKNFGGSFHESMVLALTQGAQDIDNHLDGIKKSFEKLQASPTDSNAQALFFNQIKEDLNSIEGQYAIVADADGNYKLQMLNGEKSKYLEEVNGQLEEMGIKMELVKDETTQEDVFGFSQLDGTAFSLMSINSEIDKTAISTQLLRDNFTILTGTDFSGDSMTRWVDGVRTQFDFLGDEVKLVGEGTDDFKLQLSDGGTSPWLDVLNEQVKAMNGKLVTVKDEAGNLSYVLQKDDGSKVTLFTSVTEEAEKAKKEIDETKKSAEKAKEKIEEPVNVKATFDADEVLGLKAVEKKEEMETIFENPILAPLKLDDTEFSEKKAEIDKDLEETKTMTIDIKMLEQADGTIETTQNRIEGLLGNIKSLEEGVSQTVSLIDNDLLGKNPLMQTMADKLEEIAKAGGNAKRAVEELNNLLNGTKFNITGEFKITGLDGAEDKIKGLATAISSSQGTIKTAVGNIQSSLNGLKVGKIDVSALNGLKVAVSQTISEVEVILGGYGVAVSNAIASANSAMLFNSAGLLTYKTITVGTISSLISVWNMLRGTLPQILTQMSMNMIQIYSLATRTIDERTLWLQQNLVGRFGSMGEAIRAQMVNISNIMVNEFRRGTSQLYDIASDIPRQIGNGISANMGSATNSLQALADNMVTRFKEALGIHSPSRVFEELGGFVIQGLTNGLSGGNLKDLGMNVFKDFGGGIFDSMDMIKAFVSGDFSAFGGGAGGAGVERWRPLVMKALQMTGQLTPANVELMLMQMATESGGNPLAKNDWDINAINGDPSIGLMQVIGSTYQAHADPRWNKGQTDPLSSLLASIRYTLSRYGSLSAGWHGVGYADGGFINHRHIAEVGEEGQEVVIPLVQKRRKRGVDLWLQTADKLGITSGLMPNFNGAGGYARGGRVGGFGISDGESGVASSSGEGTSGIIRPEPSKLFRAIKPVFADNASKSKPKNLDALYKRDTSGLNINLTESYLTKANQKLKTLNENTLTYRNQVLAIQRLNRTLLAQEKAQLTATKKRQKVVEAELRKLKQTGKHTEAQRKKWNELNQEYDNNSKAIWKSEEAVDALNNTIQEANYDNHIDYLNEISNKWEAVIEKINKTSNKLDFQLQKLQLTDEHDVGGQLKIRYDMLEQQMKLEKTYQNQIKSFQKEYNHVLKKFGKNDKRTIEAKKLLDKSEEDYQKSILDTMKMEKSIKDEREKVAKDSIGALKTYYKQMEALSKNALAKEKENLKKAHDEKMKNYDEEIAKINEVYDAKLKERDEEKNEKAYSEKMNEYNQERTDLMQKISMASKDTSLEGRKKLSDLQKQLLDLNKEISKAQEDRADELWKKELDKQKEQQLEKIKDDKEAENESYEKHLEALEKREKEIMDYYKKMTSDETAWKEATDAWNKGDTSILTDLMNQMQDGLGAIMGGDGTGIMGSENLSEEDLKELLGDSMLDVSNIWLDISDQLKELNSINKNLNDLNAKGQSGGTVKNPVFTNGGANTTKPTTSQPNVKPDLKDKPSSGGSGGNKPSGVKGNHTVVRGDTLWDLAKKYYGNYYQWKKIQTANGGINPYLLPVGKKLIIPFKSGGYTGDWNGDGGKVAMLHKKELVLNQQQTRDILDTVSVLDKAKSKMSSIIENTRRGKTAEQIGGGSNFGDVNLYFDGFKGTKKEGEIVAKALLDSLKKRK